MSELTTAVITAFAPIRLDVDTTDPFVTFSLETGRINATFRQILDALGAVQGVLGSVAKKVDSHDEDIQRVRTVFDSLTKRVDEHDERFNGMDSILKTIQSRQADSERILKEHDSKLLSIEQRLKATEQLADQIKQQGMEIQLIKGDVKDLQRVTGDHTTELKAHTTQIKNCNENINNLTKKHDAEAARLKVLYDVFEIDESGAKQAITGKAKDGLSAQAAYCHTLPSFAGLRKAVNKDLEDMQNTLQSQIASFQKKCEEDIQNLRSKLGEKVDRREFDPFVHEVRDELRKITDINSILQKLQSEMAGKAVKEECEQRFQKLEMVKADKADLIGLLRHDDLHPVEHDMQELRNAFDSLCSKMNLEMRDARNAAGAASGGPALGSDDGTLAGRVNALEALGRWLSDNKADKKDLNDLYAMLEKGSPAFLKAKPGTPTMEEGRRHGSLAPLGRPTSADKTERRGSIPESVRPPTPPLNYTSSPIKYVPNNAKYRATASLFDSDGNRTSASVTAARAVPSVEHWNNVARHVAGETAVPCGHVLHEIPNN